MKKYSAFIVISLSFASFNVFAARPTFHCYSYPNVPVQAYEYSSGSCGGLNSKAVDGLLGKNAEKSERNPNGTKSILCMYTGVCHPGDKNEPPEKSVMELTNEINSGVLKQSVLVCLGRGKVDPNGMVSEADCPKPSKCQRDIFYNFVSRSFSPGTPERVVAPKVEGIVK